MTRVLNGWKAIALMTAASFRIEEKVEKFTGKKKIKPTNWRHNGEFELKICTFNNF